MLALGHLALRGLAALTALLPWSALGRLGAVLGWVAGSVLRVRRRDVVAAMSTAGVASPEATARAMYRGLGTGALELMWMAGASPRRREAALRAHVTVDDGLRAALDEALAAGPVVIAASHTANWELAAYAAARLLAARGRRLTVVAKPLSVGAVHSFTARLRAAGGVDVLPPSGAVAAARRALRRGAVVAMMIDQVPDRLEHGVRAPFLGREALCDRAPAAIAKASGAALLVVGARRTGRGQRVELLAAIAPSPGPAGEVTATMASSLDAFVRRAPSDWLWLHRRWRGPRGLRESRAQLVASAQPG